MIKKNALCAFLLGLLLPLTTLAVELTNVSTRGNVGSGTDTAMSVGFVLSDSGSRQFVLAGVGPSTSINGALADPEITLLNQATGETIISCDNWRSCLGANLVSEFLGKNGLSLDDNEAAISISLDAGRYVVELKGVDETSGVGLGAVEVENLGVDSDTVRTGTWGNEFDSVCFHVTQLFGSQLTPDRDCPDDTSINVFLNGNDAAGNSCLVTIKVDGDIDIENGEFTKEQLGPEGKLEVISGVFTTDIFARGTAIESNSGEDLSDACIAEWDANNF